MSVSTTITLDNRRMKKRTGKYPVKLLVTYERIPQRYQTIYELTEEEFKKLSSPRINDDLKAIKEKLKEIQWDAEKAAKVLDPFTFEEFEKDFILNNSLFYQRKSIKKSTAEANYLFDRKLYEHRFPIFKETIIEPGRLLAIFLHYIDKLLQKHRIGTAVSYQSAYYNLIKFRGNARLTEITVTYLNQYKLGCFRKIILKQPLASMSVS